MPVRLQPVLSIVAVSVVVAGLLGGVAVVWKVRQRIHALRSAIPTWYGADWPRVKSLLGWGVNVNTRGQDGTAPLTVAVWRSDATAASELLSRGANPNTASHRGATPLMAAVRTYNTEVTILLLKHGADPNQKDENADTALTWAVRMNAKKVLRALLECAGPIDLQRTTVVDALNAARRTRDQDAERVLRRYLAANGAATRYTPPSVVPSVDTR